MFFKIISYFPIFWIFNSLDKHSTKGGSNIAGDDISTESHGDSNITGDGISADFHGGPNYAAIVGGIVGVLLIIFIIVGVLLLSRRNCSESGNAQREGKKNVMTKLNPTYDPTDGQTKPENNQPAHLMNSPDVTHISTLHAVNVDNAANEVSNTYSHVQNAVEDSDVMYDHTIRHNIHDTCDGDYGIALRRITEDDYDVSGSYRQSLSKKADPIYN